MHGRLTVAMRCFVDAKGGNELAEKRCNKLNGDATIVVSTELEDEEDGNNAASNMVADLAEFELDLSNNDSL